MHGPSGDFVGADSMGNRYYESKTADLGECLAVIPSTVKQAKTFCSNTPNSHLNSGQVLSLPLVSLVPFSGTEHAKTRLYPSTITRIQNPSILPIK